MGGGSLPIGRPGEPQAFFDDVDRAYVVAQLESRMEEPVPVSVSTGGVSPLLAVPGGGGGQDAAESARAQRLVAEVAGLVPGISVRTEPAGPGDPSPVLTLGGPAEGRVRFLGVPRVNLFRLFLEAVRRASTRDWDLAPDRAREVAALPGDVRLLAFATPTCPACPPTISLAVRLALAGPRVQVDVVDGLAFTDLVLDWGVSGVPTVVLNEQILVEGPVPEALLVEFVRHVADPRHPAPLISSVPFRSCGRLEVAR